MDYSFAAVHARWNALFPTTDEHSWKAYVSAKYPTTDEHSWKAYVSAKYPVPPTINVPESHTRITNWFNKKQ
jgi:hypothetical protein